MIITENVDNISADLDELDDCTKLFAEDMQKMKEATDSVARKSVARLPSDWTDVDFEDVPPRQLSFAPGGVVKARAERGSWDIWFLTTCNGVRTWQYTDGEWAGSDELNEGELIHDEGATQ